MATNIKLIVSGASSKVMQAVLPELLNRYDVLGLIHQSRPGELHQAINLRYYRLDLENPHDIDRLCGELKPEINDRKIVFIHAATVSIDNLVIKINAHDLHRMIQVNALSMLQITQNVLPYMIKIKWGRIILISSVVASDGAIGATAYSASKTMAKSILHGTALELARFNVFCNTITLGYFNVGLINTLSEDNRVQILNRIPVHKYGDPRELIRAFDLLINTEYITREELRIAGGL